MSAVEQRCVAIADTVVPNYRNGKRAYSCTSQVARMWQAAYDGAAVTMSKGDEITYSAAAGSVRHPICEDITCEGDPCRAMAGRFWLIVHEPGKVPDRKGSWPCTDLPKVMREFIAARPTAYLTVLTVGADGMPDVQHGPEALQMADGRSMSVGSKHNARTLAAHSAAATTPYAAATVDPVREAAKPWADYHGDLPDYDHPLRPVYESGIQYAVELLAKELGVTEWAPCDGTEEFDGDLGGTLMNIVLAAMPEDEHGDPIHPRDVPAMLAAPAGEVAIWSGEHRAYWRRGSRGEGANYTLNVDEAGMWSRADAVRLISHCGPEKLIALHDRPTTQGGAEG